MAGEAAMSRVFAVVGGGLFLLTGLLSAHPVAAAETQVEPTAARPGEVWTVYGVPEGAEIAWSLTPPGSMDALPLDATYDGRGIARVVVPRVEPGRYELVGRWRSGDVEQSFRAAVAVLEAPPQRPSPPAEQSADVSASADAGATKHRDQPPVDRLGFRIVADPGLSFAIDVMLVVSAAIVLWRSRWIRLIVLESVRHPSRPATVEREGGDVTIRAGNGAIT